MTLCRVLLVLSIAGASAAPTPAPSTQSVPPVRSETALPPPRTVDVKPEAQDVQIGERVERILSATGWFENPRVRVRDGVVFVSGIAENADYKKWATDLVHNTQDVVAVVNKMDVSHPAIWNLKPALDGVEELWRASLQGLPFFAVGIAILLITLVAARVAKSGADRVLRRRVAIPLIRDLIARAVAMLVLIVGVYLVLKVSGTTQLALTVLGGTGLFGLVIGIAFRDITENFLASIFLSMQRPFQLGDLVEIVGITGYIDRLTVRTTVVMTMDGNYVQIPNATVYKSTIRNFTNNPNRRDDFAVNIPYSSSIANAQDAAMKVLDEHPAILKTPEATVLVDHLNANSVELRVYFWIDCVKHNFLAVRSSVIRLVLHALREADLLAPAGPNEVVFPQGVPVHLLKENRARISRPADSRRTDDGRQPVATSAEGHLKRSPSEIEVQAADARPLEVGPDLLK